MDGKFRKSLLVCGLAILLVAVPLLGAGCQKAATPTATPTTGLVLAQTMVPDVTLDVYVYLKQEAPTKVPKDLVGAAADFDVASLALWGIVGTDNNLTVGGALTFVNAAEASQAFSQLKQVSGVWTLLSDNTIYFVEGSGTAAGNLQTAIQNKKFKKYDDQTALQAVATLPEGGQTRRAGVAIARPTPALLKPITTATGSEASKMVETLLSLAQLQIIVGGIYAPQQIDVAELVRQMKTGKIWTANLGVLALIKSSLPGAVVSPIVKRYLDNAGFTSSTANGLTVYRAALNVEAGVSVPVLIRIEGNELFLGISGQEAYARTLVTGANP